MPLPSPWPSTTADLAPLVALIALFVLGLPVFWLRERAHRAQVTVDKEHRALLGGFFQRYLLWMLGPIERALVAARVRPNALTALSALLALGAGAALAVGRFGLGGWLYLFTGIVDIFDGRVARATGRASAAGAFVDSFVDRVAEGALFAGLAWYYRALDGGRVLPLVIGALVASYLVSYARARGEGLGVAGADVGAMQRPERILFLGLGLVASPLVAVAVTPPIAAMQYPAIAGLALVALASSATALRRFLFVYRTLAHHVPRAVTPLRTRPSTPADLPLRDAAAPDDAAVRRAKA